MNLAQQEAASSEINSNIAELNKKLSKHENLLTKLST